MMTLSIIEEGNIASELRRLYQGDQDNPAETLEAYLNECLSEQPWEIRLALLERLAAQFQAEEHIAKGPQDLVAPATLEKLVPMLLGHQHSDEINCSTEELVERLAASLNTVFDTLNELILGINTTFMGKACEDETIRLVIRSNVNASGDTISLHDYLAQIKEAFAIMHQAFTEAAMIKMEEMLRELDPRLIQESLNGGLKIGPFQKAEMYKIFEEKYQTLNNWHRTGLLKEALLREFEKHCQSIYASK